MLKDKEAILLYGNIEKLNNYSFNLSNDRKRKIDAFKFIDDKKRCALAELLLRQGLDVLGLDSNNIQYRYNKNGKPYLDGNDLFFNISHSKDYVVCIISNEEVGIDIQKIGDINLEIANRCFLKKESDRIKKLDNHIDKLEQFYRLWTLKEAYIKALGVGMECKLDSFDVFDTNIGYKFKELSNFNGYKCAICAKSNLDIILLEYKYE